MTRKAVLTFLMALALAAPAGAQLGSQSAPSGAPGPATAAPSTASVGDVNPLLAQLEENRNAASTDLAGLRIEKWKTDSGSKGRAQSSAESLRRNLTAALPELVAQVQAAPQDFAATFKLYRNLNALYDVMTSLAESARSFGARREYEALARDASSLERVRRALADRLEALAAAKDAELVRLRSQVPAQTSAPRSPKKIVVDEDTAPKKPRKKRVPAGSTVRP